MKPYFILSIIAAVLTLHPFVSVDLVADDSKISDSNVGDSSVGDSKIGDSREQGPSIQEAVSAFVCHDGIGVTLAAHEPDVIDPVAVRFDHQGRMWVVEMRDYPTGPADGKDFNGCIKILVDEDRDGFFEKSTLFAGGLIFPTGVQPWRDGVIVTLSGSIQFMADKDGDGKCDLRETWFEGFSEGNEQLRANHPVLGPDGLVYVAGGLRGGKIYSTDPRWQTDNRIVDMTKSDFAFDPQGGFFDAVAGNSQHGLTIDDFGNRVGCSNRNPAIQTLLDLKEIRGNRWSSPQDAVHDIGRPGAKSKVAAIARSWTTSHTHAGQFSAACGVTLGLGTRTPARWKNDLVVCEPTAYAVQRQRVQVAGIARESQRIAAPQEMLSSRNDWFRPVDTIVGLDGALYIVDMCRAVIEHPSWVPAELKERPDERWGDDLGRIWRLSELSQGDANDSISLTPKNSTAEIWAKRLDHPNPAIRQVATEWLAEQDKSDVEDSLLRRWDDRSQLSEVGYARLYQLLYRGGLVDAQMAQEAAKHGSPRVRRLVTKRHVSSAQDCQLLDELLSDTDVGVRFDAIRLAACWADQWDDSPTLKMVAAKISDVIRQDFSASTHQEYWLTRLRCLPPNLSAEIAIDLVSTDVADRCDPAVLYQLSRSAAFASVYCQERLVSDAVIRNFFAPELAIVFTAAWSQAHQTAGRNPVDMFQRIRHPIARKLIETARQDADKILANENQPDEIRLRAIDTMVGFQSEDWQSFHLLLQDDASDLRVRLVPLLFARSVTDATVRRSLVQWFDKAGASMTAELQTTVIDQMVRYPIWMIYLLERLEQQSLPATLLSIQQTERLLNVKDESIAKRASVLFEAARQDRLAVIEDYRSSISGIADLKSGKALFRQHCAACHRIADTGIQVGPDISDSRTKTPAYLLTAILDPNAAVDAGFLSHQILTLDGEIVIGTLIATTEEFVTLQVNGGERKTIERDNIDMMKATGKSMMPDGFEGSVSPDRMRDLIGYLKGWRYFEQGRTSLDLDSL